jgi:hypothetical protein
MNEQTIFPAFAFQRRHHVELEAGFILAGQLIVDIPKTKKPKKHQRRMVMKIIQQLTAEAQSGRMPLDGLIFGWHGGVKPPNAVDTNDDAIMSAWADRSTIIAVRVDPRPPSKDGPRLDSDALAQMGLLKHDA